MHGLQHRDRRLHGTGRAALWPWLGFPAIGIAAIKSLDACHAATSSASCVAVADVLKNCLRLAILGSPDWFDDVQH